MSLEPSWPSSGTPQRLALRRILITIVASLLVLLTSGSLVVSRADSLQQMRVTRTHIFEFPAENPCGGRPRTISVTYEAIFKVATPEPTDDALAWTALDETGAFQISGAGPDRPTYQGVFTLTLGEPGDRHSQPEAVVLRLVGHGSDGSPFAARLFEHIIPREHGFDIALTTDSLPLAHLTCS